MISYAALVLVFYLNAEPYTLERGLFGFLAFVLKKMKLGFAALNICHHVARGPNPYADFSREIQKAFSINSISFLQEQL